MITTLHQQLDLAQQAVLDRLDDPDADGALSRLEDLVDISRHNGVTAVTEWLDPRVLVALRRDGVPV
ncbi:hypothetical protein GCM10027047_26540 [Rhodococcus aerolatus]